MTAPQSGSSPPGDEKAAPRQGDGKDSESVDCPNIAAPLGVVNRDGGGIPRNIKSAEQTGGWLWIEKDAVDRILLKTQSIEPASIIAVYAALCRLASDRGNATGIQAGKAVLAKLSGVSTKTVQRAISELAAVGLIQIRRKKSGKKNEDNSYSLLACRQSKTQEKGMDFKSVGTANGAFGVPVLKEIEQKGGGENARTSAPLGAQAVVSSPSEIEIQSEPQPGQPKRKKRSWGDGV